MKTGKEIVEKKCNGCGKAIYVCKDVVRNEMFCTIGCMDKNKN